MTQTPGTIIQIVQPYNQDCYSDHDSNEDCLAVHDAYCALLKKNITAEFPGATIEIVASSPRHHVPCGTSEAYEELSLQVDNALLDAPNLIEQAWDAVTSKRAL